MPEEISALPSPSRFISTSILVSLVARLILGSDYRMLLPGAALLGAAVVMISDTFARTIFAPTELPVGILMAMLGAPFFLYLLRKELYDALC